MTFLIISECGLKLARDDFSFCRYVSYCMWEVGRRAAVLTKETTYSFLPWQGGKRLLKKTVLLLKCATKSALLCTAGTRIQTMYKNTESHNYSAEN